MKENLPQNIVVFLPNWVGDVVMATPVLRSLREHFKQSRIVYFGKSIALDVIAGNEWADDSIDSTTDAKSKLKVLKELNSALKAQQFDLAILLTNSFRTALLAKISKIKRIVGYVRDGRGWMLHDKLTPPKDIYGKYKPVPAIDYYTDLVSLLDVRVENRNMELPVSKREEFLAQRLLDDSGADPQKPIVMLNPGASFGMSKMWAPERYAKAADELIKRRDAQIIINVAPSEKHIGKTVTDNMELRPILNFAERDNTLLLLRSLLKRTTLLITNDTGARHIGAAMGAGLVTIFGSTDPRWTIIDYPFENIVRLDLPCSPCQKKLCPQPPGPGYMRCLETLDVESVVESAEDMLDRVPGPVQRGGWGFEK